MKARLLITGGAGLLGMNWALSGRNKYAVTVGMHNRDIFLPHVEKAKISLASITSIIDSLNRIKPDLVIHTVGLTNIERCELHPEEARYINVELAANVAKSCARLGVPLVHISSDHLFSGHEEFVGEEQPVNPQNIYAHTKAEAEVEVLKQYPHALVVRTNFYGWGLPYRISFSDFIINNFRSGKSLTLFQDVFYTPLDMDELIRAVHALVVKNANGIFHVVGDERISKYQFGLKVAEHFKLDSNLINVGNISDNLSLVKRPADMSLSNEKTCNMLGRNLGGIDEQLIRLKEQETTGFVQALKTCCFV